MVQTAAFYFLSPCSKKAAFAAPGIWGKKTSPHSLHRRMGGSPIDRTGFPTKPLGFAGAPDQTQMGRRSPPISRFCPSDKTLVRRTRGEHGQSPLRSGQKTSPHSLQRRMGGSLIDRTVHWSVPLTFTDCRSDTNRLGESGKLWELPILKTALHADICSGIYQNVLVWLIIVSVFRLWGCFQKLLAVDTYSIPNGFSSGLVNLRAF